MPTGCGRRVSSSGRGCATTERPAMPTSKHREPGTGAGDVSPAPGAHDGDGSLGPLTLDQIQRWAARIAEGEGEFPEELSALDRERLAAEVRRRLRARLLTLIARAIAQD